MSGGGGGAGRGGIVSPGGGGGSGKFSLETSSTSDKPTPQQAHV